MYPLLLLCCLGMALGDVSHILKHEASTEPPPPRPYVFSYTAGRYPGHADRQHTEVSDGSGVIRGSFSYVDPRQKVRTVDYIADKQGFHPVLSDQPPEHPVDSEAVALEKERHYRLYQHIAEQHASNPHPGESTPRQSAAVQKATANHAELFRRIAEQHARIAAERELLQHEADQELFEKDHQDIEH